MVGAGGQGDELVDLVVVGDGGEQRVDGEPGVAVAGVTEPVIGLSPGVTNAGPATRAPPSAS